MNRNASLISIVNEHLNSTTLQLPVYAPIATEIQTKLASDDFAISDLSKIIYKDQTLSAQVLRIANSAFFSGMTKVTTIKDAIVRLGTKQVLNCVIVVTQKANYSAKNRLMNAYMKRLWQHSLASAIGTMWLAGKLGYRDQASEAFLAGLMHDAGKLLLLKVLSSIEDSCSCDVEFTETMIHEVMGSLHTQCGHILLRRWNLPEIYCVVARDHHREDFDEHNHLNLLVRVVDHCCAKLGIDTLTDPSVQLTSLPEVQVLGAKPVVLAELEIQLEDVRDRDI